MNHATMNLPTRRVGARPDLGWRRHLQRLAATLLWPLLLVACGGGSETQDPPAPNPGPGTGAAAFTLFPARLGLAIGGEGRLLALQPPGALSWASSNSMIASVDALGQVTALAEGSAVITASSGTANTSSNVKVYPSTAPSGTALIDAALAQSRISTEQALMYQVFALFGDERLPAEFEGPPDAAPNHLLLRELATTIGALSPETQAVLRPFLVPPIYAESWFAQRLGLTASAAATAQRADPTRATRLGVPTFICSAVLFPYQKVSTEHFNIYYLGGAFLVNGTTEVVALIASLVEQVYTANTGLLNRFPLDDSQQACNGGDGKYDIYYMPGAVFGGGAWVTAYPLSTEEAKVSNACAKRPSYMMLNSLSNEFFSATLRPGASRLMVKSVLAHEFLHALQFAMDRQASCRDTAWFDEATAQWVMDYVVPTIPAGDPGEFGMEDGALDVAPNLRKSGTALATYLYADHMVSIEKPGFKRKLNGYADYLFFQYLARTQTPDKIKQIYDAMAGGKNSVEAIAAVVDMKATWPEFAKTLWIGVTDKLLDYWNTEDEYRFGLADVYAQVPANVPSALKDKLKSLEIDQKGEKSAKFELLQNALVFPAEFYEIEPRSLFYEHLKFTDPTVHYVEFFNPIADDPNNGSMKVQALRKIGGQWQSAQDWTEDAFKLFCLDKKDERLEELLIIVSNSEVNRGAEVPYQIAKDTAMRVSTSNIGCWRWEGSASLTTNSSDGPVTVESVAAAVFDVFRAPSQGRNDLVGLDTFKSSNSGTASYRISGTRSDGCTISGAADSPLQGDGQLLADGGIIVTYLLPDQPINRTADGRGSTNIPEVTAIIACPGKPPEASTRYQDVHWLSWPGSIVPVSADGQTISGRWDRTDSDGFKSSVWNFKAMREQ